MVWLEFVIFGGLAAVILFQLYAVLGRRIGRGPDDVPATQPAAIDPRRPLPPPVDEGVNLTGLAALRARDPSFDIAHFLAGARSAYMLIVKAYAAGDRAALRPLLSPEIMSGFEAGIAQRETEGRSESVEFLHEPRADFEGVTVADDLAKASVRFLAEQRRRSKGPEGEAVDDQRAAEIWTFQRNLKSRDPNWTLIHVDAAEA